LLLQGCEILLLDFQNLGLSVNGRGGGFETRDCSPEIVLCHLPVVVGNIVSSLRNKAPAHWQLKAGSNQARALVFHNVM